MTEIPSQQSKGGISRRQFCQMVGVALGLVACSGDFDDHGSSGEFTFTQTPNIDPTAEAASSGRWKWNNESCSTDNRDLDDFEQLRFMPGIYEGNFAILSEITVTRDDRTITYCIVFPSDEQGQPIFEPNSDIAAVIQGSIRNTCEIMLAAGFPTPKTFELKNDVTGETKHVIPVILTPPRETQNPLGIIDGGDGWSPQDLFAFGACEDSDGWTVQFDPNDDQVGMRYRKVVNIEHPTEEFLTDPRVLVMMAIAAAHEVSHSWQTEFPMFTGSAHRAFLRIDFEAFATWFGLFTQWDGQTELLPMYADFLLGRADRKLGRIWAHAPYVEIDGGQRDYGAFIFWRGVQLLLEQVSDEHDLGWGPQDIAIQMASIHRECNLRVMDYLGLLGGGTPEPHNDVQGIGRRAYEDVLFEHLGSFGFQSGEKIHQRAAVQGFVDFYIQDGWINNDLLELEDVDLTSGEAIFSYRQLDSPDTIFLNINDIEGELEFISHWIETDDIDPYVSFAVIVVRTDGSVEILLPERFEDENRREFRLRVNVPRGAQVIVSAEISGSVSLSQRNNYPDLLGIRRVSGEQARFSVPIQVRREPVFAATA